jgi:hypothetical protein
MVGIIHEMWYCWSGNWNGVILRHIFAPFAQNNSFWHLENVNKK